MTSIKQKSLKTETISLSRLIKANWLSVLFFISVFFLYLLSPADTDLGWHLRYGKQIFEEGQVYKENQIGFYLADYQWTQSYSLYQLLVFIIHKLFGLWGLVFSNGIVLALIFYLTCKQKGWKMIGSALFVFFGLTAVTKLGIRSQLFTILGISFLLRQLTSNKKILFIESIHPADNFCFLGKFARRICSWISCFDNLFANSGSKKK
jgi:hypothetical protein